MCNEKLNLVQLLSNCHRGTKLWCPLFGEVEFDIVEKDSSLPIICTKNYPSWLCHIHKYR